MSGMWATPVIRVNYSGISGKGQESARNLLFPGVIWRTAMPQLRTFVTFAITGSKMYRDKGAIHFAARVDGIAGRISLRGKKLI